MSLLNKASLICTPNAVKESKLYSIVPSNGNGDMDVVRATTATRVNSAGLIEVVPRNFLTYSEQFNDIIWSKQNSTIVQNFAIAPNGIGDADLCYPTSVGNFRGFRQLSTTSIGLRTKSIFAKQSGKIKFYIRFDDATYVTFDLAIGSIFQNTTGYAATIADYGNGWYRCSATNNIATSTSSMYIGLADAAGYPSVTPNGIDGVLFWGAQDDVGSLTEYFPTTTRLNIPRLNYDVVGGCPSILVEPQRTNLNIYSEDFSNALYFKANTTITPNIITSPDGNINATLISRTATGIPATITKNSVVSSNVFTATIYAKLGTVATNFGFRVSGTYPNRGDVLVNLSNGTIIGTANGGTNTNTSATITDAGNGWYKISLTTTSASTLVQVAIIFNATNLTSINGWEGSNTVLSNAYVWGVQLEQGSYPTSYIPTVASSQTRNADVISRNNIYTNGLITSAGGTWFVDLENNFPLIRDAASSFSIQSSLLSQLNGFVIKTTSASSSRLFIGKRQADVESLLYTTLTNKIKVAIKWNGTTADIFVNGVKVVSATSFTSTVMEYFNFNTQDVPKYIKSTMLFPSPLTDLECQQLTTL